MNLIRHLWNKVPLIIILVVSSLLISALGWIGRSSLYSDYTLRPQAEPGLSLVLQGIHDGIYPWELIFPKRAAADPADAEAQEQGAVSAAVRESGVYSVADTAVDAVCAPLESVRKEYVAQRDEVVDEMAKYPGNAFPGPVDMIPEGVCNPVMQAADYGTADVTFLSPDDTVYNDDTEGIFAKRGVYFKLQAVDSSYFKDALFIGDSRTVGLCEYGGLKGDACFLARESINVYNIFDTELRFTDLEQDSWDWTVEEALADRRYGKVYVNLGVNELGIGTTYMYYERYRKLLEMVREYQPDAIIYIQGIMHVSEKYSRTDICRNNIVVVQRNTAISTLANGYDIFYIDMNPYVCNENGDLIEDLSGDGIHLKASAYENWDRSLMENAVVTGKGRE